MLQVKKLNILHKKDYRVLLTDFDLVLNKGDKAVIIGEEGNGKSTILKWIYNSELVENYVEATGECISTGERLGYLPQELSKTDAEKTIYEFFCEDDLLWNQEPKELNLLAKKLGLAPDMFYMDRKMQTLSGGEKIKLQIARLEMQQPTVFLLDEPSNDIDIETLEWMEQWIKNTEKIFLFISHDETLIERTTNMVIHIEQLRRKTVSKYTVSRTPYNIYIEQRNRNMNNQEQKALTERKEEQIKLEKFRRMQQKVENAQSSVSRQDPHTGKLLKKKMHAVKAMEHRLERDKENMTELPEEESPITISFREDICIPNGKTVLEFESKELFVTEENSEDKKVLAKDIFLRIRGNEKICIIGKNGAGKSTLLKQIAKEMLEREDIRAVYMPQNYEDELDMNITPVEYLSETGDKEETTKIRTYLGSMKYTFDEMEHQIKGLSGGQRAKILMLKMILSGANVLILDEPTRNFSPLSNPIIRKMLKNFGGSIISISHDRKYINEVCDTVYELNENGLKTVEIPQVYSERM